MILIEYRYRTWFNRLGNREMYMRCHKATIGGSGAKGAFDALPNMFVANIQTTTCKIAEGISVNFPNPGSQVQGSGNGNPTGACGSKGIGKESRKMVIGNLVKSILRDPGEKRSIRFSADHMAKKAI